MLAAFCTAVLVTKVGSIIPDLIMSTYSSWRASKPLEPLLSFTLFTTTESSKPAFLTIILHGASRALFKISAPTASSADRPFISIASIERSSATPPPATIPSFTAALVACNASSTLAFFSLSSTSVAAPIFKTATPPESLAKRSCSFSLS